MVDNYPRRSGDSASSREELLVRTFVELSDTLVNHYDVIDLLGTLAHRCVELLAIEEAGIVLTDRHGNLMVVASSSERMRMAELFELQAEEGPCLDCFHSRQPVRVDDLEAMREKWPRFGPSALEAGFRSVYALPMRLRDDCVGALNLFANRYKALDRPDAVLGQALADAATISILQQRFLHEHQELHEQLQTALDTRIAIEQAKGMVAAQAEVEVDAAFGLLRNYAQNHNVAPAKVARAVVDDKLNAAVLQHERGSRRPRR